MLRNSFDAAPAARHTGVVDVCLARHRPWLERLGEAAVKILCMAERRRQRLALLELDSRLLRDIGLTRSDVREECTKPFWRS